MKLLYICILSIFFASCYNRQNKQEVQQISIDRSLPPYLSSYIEKFELPYDQHTGADSNTLFFYYSGRFDTSFLVHLHKEDTTVTGVLYEILPAYHKDDDDYADRKSSLLFFEGYSFKIDASKWEYLISNARNKLLIEKNMPKRNEACADCPSYFFAHAYNTISSNSNNRAVFEAYSKFLKDSLLNQFITMRQPKLHKTSNK